APPGSFSWENRKPRSQENTTHDLRSNCYGPHPGLFLHYHRCAAAERQERGYFRSLWRTGQPDRVRSSGRGQRTLQGHHMVSCGVHGYFHHVIGICRKAWRPSLGIAGTEIATGQDAASSSANARNARRAAEINLLSCSLRLMQRAANEGVLHQIPQSSPAQIYRFSSNCICRTEDVPSVLGILDGGIACRIVMATVLSGF